MRNKYVIRIEFVFLGDVVVQEVDLLNVWMRKILVQKESKSTTAINSSAEAVE